MPFLPDTSGIFKQGKSEGFDSCDQPSNLKLDSNCQFFSPCDLEIWWMTSTNNGTLFLYYVKLCASFQIHRWIQTGVTVRKHPIWVKIEIFFEPHDLEIWQMTLKNNRSPLLYYIKLCASFQSHGWNHIGVTVWKQSIRVKISNFLSHMTLKNNRAPLLCNIKLCASFHHHMWIQTGVTVPKRLSWVLTSVTLTFDLDLLHGHHLSLVITPENFMMIQWWEHSEKGVTDGQTDGQTDRSVLRAAW